MTRLGGENTRKPACVRNEAGRAWRNMMHERMDKTADWGYDLQKK